MLVGKNRTSKTVAGPALKNLFAALKGNIHVVVLNACYSASQAKAITSVVDCCIGMNDAVLDDAAIAFAAAFYQAIGFGESVKAAFDCGIAAISIEGISETRTPKLLCRRGVNPDKVFVLKSHSAQRTVGLSTPPRANRLLPCLVAKFQEIDGDLCRVTGGRCPEYGLDLWIEGAPPETKTAAFEILDKGFREPKWSVPRMSASESVSVREFLTDDMSSYGDVEIWIRGVGQGRGSWASQSTLYEALSRYYHGHQKSKGIRRALKQIQTK